MRRLRPRTGSAHAEKRSLEGRSNASRPTPFEMVGSALTLREARVPGTRTLTAPYKGLCPLRSFPEEDLVAAADEAELRVKPAVGIGEHALSD